MNITETYKIWRSSGLQKYITIFAILLLSTVSIIHLLRPLFDNDFYWHLKTGEWIWEHKSLPLTDPFTIPPQPEDAHRAKFVLTSYWLFQVILYLFYKSGAVAGIIIFRIISMLALFFIFYRYASIKKKITLFIISIGIIQIIAEFFPERPQFISFISVALIISLVMKYLSDREKNLFSLLLPLSITMLFWSNSHGGFLLGNILLIMILFSEGLKFLHPKLEPISAKEYLNLTAALLFAILISMVNPNHIFSFEMVRSYSEAKSIIHTSTVENSNLFEFYRNMGGMQPFLTVLTYIFTATVFAVSKNKTNITWVAILLLFGYMGFVHVRYHPFFIIVSTLFAISTLDSLNMGNKGRFFVIIFALAVFILPLSRIPQHIKIIKKYGWIPAPYFPVKVCDYLFANGIAGNVFTTIDWGGYVLWRIGDKRKIFIDGRHIDPNRSEQYFFYMDNWNLLFDRYNITTLILPTYEEINAPFPQTKMIENDPRWMLVSRINNGSLFVRR